MDKRKGVQFHAKDLGEKQAREIAEVGVIPCRTQHPVGHKFEMGGQQFVVTGYTTKEGFLDAIGGVGLDREGFSTVPDGYYFQMISTD